MRKAHRISLTFSELLPLSKTLTEPSILILWATSELGNKHRKTVPWIFPFRALREFPISGGTYVTLGKTVTPVLAWVIDWLGEANSRVGCGADGENRVRYWGEFPLKNLDQQCQICVRLQRTYTLNRSLFLSRESSWIQRVPSETYFQ